jgi:hypothetical protein
MRPNHQISTRLARDTKSLGHHAWRSARPEVQKGAFALTRLICLVLIASACLIHVIAPERAAAAGNEARCNELGGNCVCSEPFEMTGFTSGPDFWNPNDTTTKECSVEPGSIGGAIVRTSKTISISTDAAAMAAFPSGKSVPRFVRAEDNHQGTFFAGNGVPVSSSFARLAARWYIYRSPTFDFEGEGSCNNSKQSQHDGGIVTDYNNGAGFHTFGYTTFSPSIDCCMSGPAINQPNIQQMKGKWWRVEIVLTNRSGPGFRLQSFMKNVTDNAAELAVLDLAADSRVSNLTPPTLMSTILSNNHRVSFGGSCRGWIGLSHYMMAGWTTNSGQRIGAASEVESGGAGGGGGETVPPSAPTNPRISLLDSGMSGISLAGVVSPAVLVVGAAWLGLSRRRPRG